jgi:hypothetical protein
MCLKWYLALSAVVFFLVGMMHLLRVIYQAPVTSGSTAIPMWLSYGGFAGAFFFCVWAAWLIRDSRKKQG